MPWFSAPAKPYWPSVVSEGRHALNTIEYYSRFGAYYINICTKSLIMVKKFGLIEGCTNNLGKQVESFGHGPYHGIWSPSSPIHCYLRWL